MEAFFEYARERYCILLRRRHGSPPPWTADPILQRYRFCNVFREDDRTTRWIRATLSPYVYEERLLGAMVIARWFNRIETLDRLLSDGETQRPMVARDTCVLYNWDLVEMRRRLEGVSPLVTGAYMVNTPIGMSKLEGLIWCLEQILPDAVELQRSIEPGITTLQHMTSVLSGYPHLGPFMAYEIATDLRRTPLLDMAPDIMTWANPGPGAARGLGRVLHGDPTYFKRLTRRDAEEMQLGMRSILRESHRFWPERWPQWEMRDVEHTLCEFDKFERARLGEGAPKQLYRSQS